MRRYRWNFDAATQRWVCDRPRHSHGERLGRCRNIANTDLAARAWGKGDDGEEWWKEVEEKMSLDEHLAPDVGKHHQLHAIVEHFTFGDDDSEAGEARSQSRAKRHKQHRPDIESGATWWQEVEEAMIRNPIATACTDASNAELSSASRSGIGAKRSSAEGLQIERPLKIKRPG